MPIIVVPWIPSGWLGWSTGIQLHSDTVFGYIHIQIIITRNQSILICIWIQGKSSILWIIWRVLKNLIKKITVIVPYNKGLQGRYVMIVYSTSSWTYLYAA